MSAQFKGHPNSLNMVLARVQQEFDISAIIAQLENAMRRGSRSEVFTKREDVQDVRDLAPGQMHPMQASRLESLGWSVQRTYNTFTVYGWGVEEE